MRRALLTLLVVAGPGCVKVPEIVVTDRVTALEAQAGGSYEELEQKLTRAGIAPRPLPLTPAQLEALGLRRPEELKDPEQTRMDQLDRLLRRRCVGEGNDGLLAETPKTCRGAVDRDEVSEQIDRTNRARTELWAALARERPKATLAEVRAAWTRAHQAGVICGAWVQAADGSWGPKSC